MKALGLLPLFLLSTSCLLGCAVNDTEAFHQSESFKRTSQPLKDAAISARSDVVAVLSRESGVDSWCTGIVLEPGLVLTAEHCLSPSVVPHTTLDCASATLPSISAQVQAWVVTGENVKTDVASQYHGVSHARLPAGATQLCGEDIVLLELTETLDIEAAATLTAELPSSETEFLAVGYGTDGVTSGVQRENPHAHIACIGAQCQDARVDSSEFLASSNACEGDSGSPAIDNRGRSFAMAVRSNASCSETAYLQLGRYFDWLASNVAGIAAAHGRSTPAWALVNQQSGDGGTPLDSGVAPVATAADKAGASVSGGGCALTRVGAKPMWGMQLLMLTGLAVMVVRRKTLKLDAAQ